MGRKGKIDASQKTKTHLCSPLKYFFLNFLVCFISPRFDQEEYI